MLNLCVIAMKRDATIAQLSERAEHQPAQHQEGTHSIWVDNIPRPGIVAFCTNVPTNSIVDDTKEQVCFLLNDELCSIRRSQFRLMQQNTHLPLWMKVRDISNNSGWTFHLTQEA